MKKVMALVLVICLLFMGCNAQKSAETAPTKAVPKTVVLTEDNVYDYFTWDLDVENYECTVRDSLGSKVEKGTADCKITLYKKIPCTPSNVTIEFEVYPLTGTGWEETQKVRITVPVDGIFTKTISFESKELLTGVIDEPYFDFKNVSVSGTVQLGA